MFPSFPASLARSPRAARERRGRRGAAGDMPSARSLGSAASGAATVQTCFGGHMVTQPRKGAQGGAPNPVQPAARQTTIRLGSMRTTGGARPAPGGAGGPPRCASRNCRAWAAQLAIAPLLAGELGLRLGDDLAVAALVAGREVEDLQAPHARGAGQRARLPRRQVV